MKGIRKGKSKIYVHNRLSKRVKGSNKFSFFDSIVDYKDVFSIICGYLDFRDLVFLSMTSRRIRITLDDSRTLSQERVTSLFRSLEEQCARKRMVKSLKTRKPSKLSQICSMAYRAQLVAAKRVRGAFMDWFQRQLIILPSCLRRLDIVFSLSLNGEPVSKRTAAVCLETPVNQKPLMNLLDHNFFMYSSQERTGTLEVRFHAADSGVDLHATIPGKHFFSMSDLVFSHLETPKSVIYLKGVNYDLRCRSFVTGALLLDTGDHDAKHQFWLIIPGYLLAKKCKLINETRVFASFTEENFNLGVNGAIVFRNMKGLAIIEKFNNIFPDKQVDCGRKSLYFTLVKSGDARRLGAKQRKGLSITAIVGAFLEKWKSATIIDICLSFGIHAIFWAQASICQITEMSGSEIASCPFIYKYNSEATYLKATVEGHNGCFLEFIFGKYPLEGKFKRETYIEHLSLRVPREEKR